MQDTKSLLKRITDNHCFGICVQIKELRKQQLNPVEFFVNAMQGCSKCLEEKDGNGH